MLKTHTQLPNFTNPYDAIASDYDELFEKSLFYSLVTEKEKTLLKRYINKSKGYKTAVDVGCGTGDFAITLAQNGYKTIGIDLSNPMLKIAEAKARKLALSSRLTFINWDALTLSKLGYKFDLIICMGSTLNHVEDWEQFFSEVSACLKPGGRIIFSIDNLCSIDEFFWVFKAGRLKRFLQTFICRLNNGRFSNEWHMESPQRSLNVHLTYESLGKVKNLLHIHQLNILHISGANLLSCLFPSVLNSSVYLGPSYERTNSILKQKLKQWILSLDRKVTDFSPSITTNVIIVAARSHRN